MSPARIIITMQSLGAACEICAKCESPFGRGETMTALEDADTGEPLGWVCPNCLGGMRKEAHDEQGTVR